MAMLEVKNLEVYYGVIQAIKGISFEVNEGEVIALIGANGAGKTTTLQTITGMLQPKAGEIIFEGKDINGNGTCTGRKTCVCRIICVRKSEIRRIYQKR